jgi:hypothetical protein
MIFCWQFFEDFFLKTFRKKVLKNFEDFSRKIFSWKLSEKISRRFRRFFPKNFPVIFWGFFPEKLSRNFGEFFPENFLTFSKIFPEKKKIRQFFEDFFLKNFPSNFSKIWSRKNFLQNFETFSPKTIQNFFSVNFKILCPKNFSEKVSQIFEKFFSKKKSKWNDTEFPQFSYFRWNCKFINDSLFHPNSGIQSKSI